MIIDKGRKELGGQFAIEILGEAADGAPEIVRYSADFDEDESENWFQVNSSTNELTLPCQYHPPTSVRSIRSTRDSPGVTSQDMVLQTVKRFIAGQSDCQNCLDAASLNFRQCLDDAGIIALGMWVAGLAAVIICSAATGGLGAAACLAAVIAIGGAAAGAMAKAHSCGRHGDQDVAFCLSHYGDCPPQ
ncbi:MAG: hypothetical protein O7D91_05860 [Planctomycetota bacterium]|nr:hypothetical protein [Planctomycetota bacterium]